MNRYVTPGAQEPASKEPTTTWPEREVSEECLMSGGGTAQDVARQRGDMHDEPLH
jgi:hypothetical protein